MLPKLHPDTFDWLSWTGGSIASFGIPCRFAAITHPISMAILRRYAVGYLEGERLVCRPKPNEVAVYFEKDEREFWFHLRKNEFDIVFKEVVNGITD